MDKASLIALATDAAKKYGLDPALVCAVIEQESGWDTWAIRYEPAFFTKYVAPILATKMISVTEAYARSFSWGLMQVMGQVAYEEGFPGKYFSLLCDPATGIDAGCKHLAKMFKAAAAAAGPIPLTDAETQREALLHWNGGGNPAYPSEVIARIPTYQV